MIKQLTATEHSADTFYPTPGELAKKLLANVDWQLVGTVLEPSAGKGDLALAVAQEISCRRRGYYRPIDAEHNKREVIEEGDVDCIEIDANLRHILTGEGFRVIHDDFMTFTTYKRYSLIAMNPPFDRGAEHLLKAISLVEACGGQVACILNAETVSNPYTYARQELQKKIKAYNGTVTPQGKAFRNADRQTEVDAVTVYISVPQPEKKSSIMDEMRKDADRKKQSETESPYQALIKGDYLEAIVDRYNYEISCGIRLIDEWIAMRPILLSNIDAEVRFNDPILELKIGSEVHRSGKDASHNDYIKRVRLKYWSALFRREEFLDQLTSNLRDDLHRMVDDLRDYDFSYYNIYTLAQKMLSQVNGGIEATILKLFDDWTIKYHWDENSQNRHYFDGWRTNDAFAVNPKIIIPFYGAFCSWSGEMSEYEVVRKITDIEKVFDFLDGGRNGGSDASRIIHIAASAKKTRNIQCRHFTFTVYKKGTCHITFSNLEVLHKFNLFAAQNKKWLPPVYGKKHYQDMTKDERHVIDSFEGKESYEKVLSHADYYLGQALTMGLTDGREGTA